MQTQAPAIILIEKDEVTLELYQRELSTSFVVFAFTEVCNVLETLAHQDIRAVIIEPESDSGKGWELIRSLQTTAREPSLPLIICSTRDPSKTGLAYQATKYLTKPVLPKTLREITLEVLGIKDELRKYP